MGGLLKQNNASLAWRTGPAISWIVDIPSALLWRCLLTYGCVLWRGRGGSQKAGICYLYWCGTIRVMKGDSPSAAELRAVKEWSRTCWNSRSALTWSRKFPLECWLFVRSSFFFPSPLTGDHCSIPRHFPRLFAIQNIWSQGCSPMDFSLLKLEGGFWHSGALFWKLVHKHLKISGKCGRNWTLPEYSAGKMISFCS